MEMQNVYLLANIVYEQKCICYLGLKVSLLRKLGCGIELKMVMCSVIYERFTSRPGYGGRGGRQTCFFVKKRKKIRFHVTGKVETIQSYI
jgi:hypothetical protein